MPAARAVFSELPPEYDVMAASEEGVAGVWSTHEMKIARSRLASATDAFRPERARKIVELDALVVAPLQFVSENAGRDVDHLRH